MHGFKCYDLLENCLQWRRWHRRHIHQGINIPLLSPNSLRYRSVQNPCGTILSHSTRLRELATTTYSGLSSPFSARRHTSFVGERYGSQRQMTLPCPPIATMQLAFSVGVTVSLGALMLSMFLCPR